MPANIVHMIIAHKAIGKLKEKGVKEYTEFAEMLDDESKGKKYRAYVNLGSVGPDLYYYAEIGESLKDLLKEKFTQAKGVTPWSYHLHSSKPNLYPLKLVEIIFRDTMRKNGEAVLDDDDIRKLAYVAGHLTHMAGDQIIHPVVNKVAKPYYRSGKHREKHRECEVFQDYFLYQEVYRLEEKGGAKYDFFKQKFNAWADCVRGSRNTKDWFRYFLQRGFVETYGISPSEDEIEDSVDNLLLMLKTCQMLFPYRKAAKDYEENGPDAGMCKEYIKDIDYIKHWRLAVELAVIYLIALYEVYFVLKKGKDFTNQHKERFGNIVSDADLSCPLKGVFAGAKAALRNKEDMEAAIERYCSPLLTKAKLVTEGRIFKARSGRDVVKA
ncbi:MAG TPA: zinc dependent phospholipase C family protein [Sedimentisphaerales bacterium]|nr:zinc dependent phospholipase C family protein [Sedimentisphaerales bacterium]